MPLDPVIHQPNRLQIMAALYRNREMSFRDLRDGLGLTPGNLGSHIARLQEAGYVEGEQLARVTPETRYRITQAGVDAIKAYLAQLRQLLLAVDASAPQTERG